MQTFIFPPEFIERFQAFLKSEEYNHTLPAYARTDYWRHHSGIIRTDISGNKVTVDGCSGYAIPSLKNKLLYTARIAAKDPSLLISLIKMKLGAIKKPRIKLFDFFEAFDAVMGNDPLADIEPSVYRLNFMELTKNPLVVGSIKQMQQRFFAKDKYSLNSFMVRAYYLWNILCAKVDVAKIRCVVDIGGGSGNLAALLWHQLKSTIIIVDLPQTLCLSISFLADLFPDAKMLLPHEINNPGPHKYDFIFLVPHQTGWIKDNSADLILNIVAFQEMSHKQTCEYFDLIKRVSGDGAYFLTQNRVEKIPIESASLNSLSSESPSRFSEYPWMPDNEILVYEICRLHRLVQLDNMFVRLERIVK